MVLRSVKESSKIYREKNEPGGCPGLSQAAKTLKGAESGAQGVKSGFQRYKLIAFDLVEITFLPVHFSGHRRTNGLKDSLGKVRD